MPIAFITGFTTPPAFCAPGLSIVAPVPARDIEGQSFSFEISVPDAASIAGSLTLAIAMLSLQIACRHVEVWLQRLRRIALTL